MKRSSSLLILALLPLLAAAQSDADAFLREFRTAIAFEDTASTPANVMAAAHRFEEMTLRYPNEWRASYWASFVYTQVGLFTGQDERLVEFLNLAQFYYDQAYARWDSLATDKSEEARADLYILQAFIANWKGFPNSGRYGFDVDAYQALEDKYTEMTEAADPNNPMLWTLRCLPKLRRDETRAEGVRECKQALAFFAEREGTLKPQWSRNFIKFWFQRFAPDALDG